MARIAFLVDNHFEQVELTGPRQRLEAQGHQTTLIATEQVKLQGWHHTDPADLFDTELMLSNANSDDFDALVLPGGVINADQLRVHDGAQQFVQAFMMTQKPVAAICHAAWLLISARVIRGCTLTAYHSLKDDICNAGAHYVDQAVCVDQNLITSRCPDDIPAFASAIHALLLGQPLTFLQHA